MLKKIIASLPVLFFLVSPNPAYADDGSKFECLQLDEKASSSQVKYSLDADVDGPVFFNGIRCGIEYRNRELCAMEMISFDTSGSVYDYYTAEKIAIGKAYFWLDKSNSTAPVLAFGSKEAAEKYNAANKGGVVLDYTALTEEMLK